MSVRTVPSYHECVVPVDDRLSAAETRCRYRHPLLRVQTPAVYKCIEKMVTRRLEASVFSRRTFLSFTGFRVDSLAPIGSVARSQECSLVVDLLNCQVGRMGRQLTEVVQLS